MSAASCREIAGEDAVRRALETLGSAASRALSNRAQSPLHVSLSSCGPARLGALADFAHPLDRAVALRVDSAPCATILVSRALAYALLALRFGGRGPGSAEPLPERTATAIEQAGLVRTALELWHALAGASAGALPLQAEAAGLVDPAELRTRASEPVTLACFLVEGLPGDTRFFIALRREAMLEGGNHEDQEVGSLAEAGRNAAARGAARGEAEAPQEELRLRPGTRVTVDLSGPRGASLRIDGRLVAQGRGRFADSRLVLEVDGGEDDGETQL